MKIKRQKLYKKTIQFYKTNYAYKEPFSVLMDPGFIKKCLNMNIYFKEALPKLLESKVSFYITPCCIAEMKRNPKEYSNDLISTCKRIDYYHCNHQHGTEETSGLVQKCFTDISVKSPNTYFFAVQDHDHRLILRKNPGIPLLFVLTNLIILEKPTTSSYQTMIKTHKAITQINPREKQMLLKLKHGENYKSPNELNNKQHDNKQHDNIKTPITSTTTTTTSTTSTTTDNKTKKSTKSKTLTNIPQIENNATTTTTTTTTTEMEVDDNKKEEVIKQDVDADDVKEKVDKKQSNKNKRKLEDDSKLSKEELAQKKLKLEQEQKERIEKKAKWLEQRRLQREAKLKKKEAIKKALEKKRLRLESGDTHKRTRRKRSLNKKNKQTRNLNKTNENNENNEN